MDGVHGARTSAAQWHRGDDHAQTNSSSTQQAEQLSGGPYSKALLGAGGGVASRRLHEQFRQAAAASATSTAELSDDAMLHLEQLRIAAQDSKTLLQELNHLLDEIGGSHPASEQQSVQVETLKANIKALHTCFEQLNAELPIDHFPSEERQQITDLARQCDAMFNEVTPKLRELHGESTSSSSSHELNSTPTTSPAHHTPPPGPGSNNPFAAHNAPPPGPGSNNPFATHNAPLPNHPGVPGGQYQQPAMPNHFGMPMGPNGQPGMHPVSPLNAHPLYSSIASMPQGMVPPHMQHGMQAGMEKSLGHYLLQQHVSDFMQMLEFLKQIHEKANKLLEIR